MVGVKTIRRIPHWKFCARIIPPRTPRFKNVPASRDPTTQPQPTLYVTPFLFMIILGGDGDFGSNATKTFCTGEPNSRISTSPSGLVPSASPSWMPSVSWMPTIGPTTLDTDVPSISPVTFTPTTSPIAPTFTPTVFPSASPTTVPPTVIPTVVYIPTTKPTPRRTQQPSPYPTVTRTELYKGDIEGLYFVITPMSSALTNKGILDWKRVTQNHIVSYWLSDGIQVDCTVQFIRQIFEPSVDATVDADADQPATTPISGGGRVLRRLREDDLTLFFSVRGISYRILNSTISSPLDITATNIAQDPFSNIRVRNDYITKLSTVDPALFGSIETLTDVRILDSNNPTNPSTENDLLLGLPSATLYALVGCVLGSIVLFFAVGLLLYVRRQKSRRVNVRNRSRAFAYEDEDTHVDNPLHHDPFANVPHRATSTQSPLPVRSFTTGPSGSGPYGGYGNTYGHPNNDDVSTLADPSPLTLGIHDNHSLAEYTVDYDYSKAYGGLGGNSIVSAAEGTLGSSQPKTLGSFTAATATSAANTSVPHRAGLANASAPTNTHPTDGDNVNARQQRQRNPSPTRSGVPPRHPPPQSQLNPQPNPRHPDPNSVVENPVLGGTVASRSTVTSQPSPPRGNRVNNRRPMERERPIQNQTVDIFAPSGKLGVVIDTPNHDAPVIHAIKDSSVVANLLRVGDSLIAVDDQDVRAMSAVKVSKLISKKSGQATRKLTIVRSRLVE